MGRTLVPTDKSYKAYVDWAGEQVKFYFWHLSEREQETFQDLVTSQRINFAFPGKFYVRPAFLVINKSAPLAFGAIVKLEREVEDGHVITLIDPFYRELVAQITRSPELIYKIDPRKWEEIIAASYDRAGFDEVILTPRSGDLGRDVVAVRRGFGSVKFIDQVKAYSPGHRVTADDVRALLGVLTSEQDASKAILTTTAEFAPGVSTDRLLAKFLPHRLELVDRERLLKRLDAIEAGYTDHRARIRAGTVLRRNP